MPSPRQILLPLLLITLFASVRPAAAAPATPSTTPFRVNDYFVVALQYRGARTIVGASMYGPASKAFQCERAAAQAVAQAKHYLPSTDYLSTTCLHVAFQGPTGAQGAVAAEVPAGKPLEAIAFAFEYGPRGEYIGAEALQRSATLVECELQSLQVIRENTKTGRIPAGNSIVVYCLPVSAWPEAARPKVEGHAV